MRSSATFFVKRWIPAFAGMTGAARLEPHPTFNRPSTNPRLAAPPLLQRVGVAFARMSEGFAKQRDGDGVAGADFVGRDDIGEGVAAVAWPPPSRSSDGAIARRS